MSDIDQLAARQLRDYDGLNPGTMFADGVRLTLDEAYALQAAVAKRRRERGETTLGYKVGCTSSAIRAQLGIDHSVFGFLWETERQGCGCTLRLSDFASPAIEGELAVELVRDLRGDDLSDAAVEAAIGCVFPVIELHHAVFRGEQLSAEELIANNALHAGFVAGETRSAFQQLTSATLSVQINGDVVAGCEGPELTSGVVQSLRWLAGQLGLDGRHLHAGEVILTGSIPKLLPLTDEAEVWVRTSHFGDVSARFLR